MQVQDQVPQDAKTKEDSLHSNFKKKFYINNVSWAVYQYWVTYQESTWQSSPAAAMVFRVSLGSFLPQTQLGHTT